MNSLVNLEVIKRSEGGYFINFGDIYSGDRSKLLLNGKLFFDICKNTELSHWVQCDEYPVDLARKSQDIINPKYVSNSPYVSKPELTVEEYHNLPEGIDDYYKRTGEYVDVITAIPFQVTNCWTEMEVSNIKYIHNIDVALLHKINYPNKEWKNLPCQFHTQVVWEILCKELVNRVNKNYLEADMYEYSGEIRLYRKNPLTNEKHGVFVIKRDQVPLISGTDYGDLLRNLDLFIESIIEPYNKPIVKCPCCEGKGFTEYTGKEMAFADFLDMIKINIRKLTNFVTAQNKKDQMNNVINGLFRNCHKMYSGTVYISGEDKIL